MSTRLKDEVRRSIHNNLQNNLKATIVANRVKIKYPDKIDAELHAFIKAQALEALEEKDRLLEGIDNRIVRWSDNGV